MLLEGKRIVVTGGMTGIGKATVLAMVREGAAVVSMSRTSPDSEQAIKAVEAAGALGAGAVKHIQCDITDREGVFEAFDEAVDFMGGLDAMVNSAGQESQQSAEDLTKEALMSQIDMHVGGTIWANQAAFRYLKKTGGSIINYSSFAGVEGVPNEAAYSVAKGAVISWCRYIAKEWGPYLVRVNCVLPAVMSELVMNAMKDNDHLMTALEDWAKQVIPLGGKMGVPEDAANLNVFLASDMSRFISGQLIGADGGMFKSR